MHMNIANLWSRYRRLVFVLVFFALLLLAVQWSGLRQNFNLAFLRQTLSGNRWEGLALFALLFTLGNLVQIPGWIFQVSDSGNTWWALCLDCHCRLRSIACFSTTSRKLRTLGSALSAAPSANGPSRHY
jgi:hypothetical protein